MKKLATILFSFLYLLLSTGVMLNMHYCGGELASISLSSEEASCCCMAIADESSCCNNEHLLIQFDNDEQVVSNSVKLVELFQYIDTETLILKDSESDNSIDEFANSEDESPPLKLAIWKTNCSFLLYG